MPIIRRLESGSDSQCARAGSGEPDASGGRSGAIALRELAVEDKPLARVLTPEETARLAGLEATLPAELRDARGKWWAVLEDWRAAGEDLPAPVSVEQALALLENEARAPGGVVALSAVALRENLGERLLGLPCVVARDGRRLVPPLKDAPEAVALEVSPLGVDLELILSFI